MVRQGHRIGWRQSGDNLATNWSGIASAGDNLGQIIRDASLKINY